MGTRSVVAIPQGDSWKGRYVHWDGYPSGVGCALIEIRQSSYRNDLPGMIKALTEDHTYWSSVIGPEVNKKTLADYERDSRVIVPGIGIAGVSEPDEWVTPDDDWGCEWCYVLTDAGIHVLEATRNGGHAVGMFGFNPGAHWTHRGLVRWDLTPWDESNPDPQGPGWEDMARLDLHYRLMVGK